MMFNVREGQQLTFLRKDDAISILLVDLVRMSVEWFHAVLGVFFVAIWLIVGQIVATDKR